ncbi:MAG: Unknown protein [uncultured Aureispira sp.]|uniref:Uncharacterized protein n=1 Tax=uncultured Aureispira sp. TaxID=1331704 RepID=A0A6S6RY98_9BACT|nr:MAG: Unknown protein [uncultured Aureispira sp.]
MDVLNPHILSHAKAHPLTKRILKAVQQKLQKGLLHYKTSAKSSKEQFLYWYPSLNAGLPVVAKKDAIHQSIYMFHDMAHTCLYDPLPDTSFQTYILGKMVGEAMAQFIADGIFASLLQANYQPAYAYKKRYYIQMYTQLQDLDIRVLSIAIAHFAIFDNRSPLIALCPSSEAKKWAHVFCNLYAKMFQADLWWNHQIYSQYKGKVFEYNPAYCYRNNKKTSLNTIEAIVDHNLALLAQSDQEETGNGLLLAQQLSQGNEFVYRFVQVNYKHTIETRILNSIRAKLRY